jgi:hypothetical protein
MKVDQKAHRTHCHFEWTQRLVFGPRLSREGVVAREPGDEVRPGVPVALGESDITGGAYRLLPSADWTIRVCDRSIQLSVNLTQ